MKTNLRRLVVNLSVLRGMGTVAALTGNIVKTQQLVWEDMPLFRKTFSRLPRRVVLHCCWLRVRTLPPWTYNLSRFICQRR